MVKTSKIIATSSKMKEVYDLVDKACLYDDLTVLIQGETGTGKEVVANTIHYNCCRKNRQFVAVNCTSIPHELAESELFGHERGAFTSAASERVGKFEAAANGTILLDEIGDMDILLQAKLLRVLENKAFDRIGGNKTVNFNARVIATTNKFLYQRVQERGFRDDLYYRLSEFVITIPPLRERREDIPALANHFLSQANERFRKNIKRITLPAMNMLMANDWYGNIRELKNVINKSVILSENEEVTPMNLPAFEQTEEKSTLTLPLDVSLLEIERIAIKEVLLSCNDNKRKTAKSLGISESTLYRKMKELNLLS